MGVIRKIAGGLWVLVVWLTAAGGQPLSAAAASCHDALPKHGIRQDRGGAVVVIRPVGGPVRIGRPFALDIFACGADGRPANSLHVDARMPAHGHGMNYRPTAKRLGPGRVRYDGLMFHMPGRWEIRVDLLSDKGRLRFRFPMTVLR